MSTVAMAKKKKRVEGSEGGGGRRTHPVQVEKDLARMAAVIASHRGIPQSDLVSPVLRPFLIAQYELTQQQIRQELDEQKKPE